jgi:predicted phage terminase large subunit-like protein
MISDHLALTALLREDLAAFIAKTFQVVSPNDSFMPAWYIDLMADYLMQCALGDITRLIITVPPRSLKSISASVALPAWVLGKDPSRKIICASYSSDLAAKFSRDCRAVMENDWYRELFPSTRLKRSAELDLETTRKGVRYATSVGGTLTGRGGSLIIIDDPLKPQEAPSETQRKSLKQWYDNTLYSRLDNKSTDGIILVMQRLHVDDLVAHVLEKEDWVHLDLPAIAEVEQTLEFSDGRRFTRQTGDVLHPEREPRPTLENIRSTIGSYNFDAQYQQQPVPPEGNLIKWSWFLFYENPPPREQGDQLIQSWDTASKATELSDYSVCTTWLTKGNDYYLLDVFRKRLEFPALQQAVINHARKWNASSVLIEDTASGTALIQNLRNQSDSSIGKPIAVTPKDDKVVRMSTQSAKIEAGHVHLPRKAPWLDEFRKEILAFPHGQHDDQVDSLSQFLNRFEKPRRIYMRHLSGL